MSRIELSIAEESKILAYAARGDTEKQIQAQIMSEFSRSISRNTILAVKRRNAETLEHVKAEMVKHDAASAAEIKDQANRNIKKQLDSQELLASVLTHASQQYLDGEITFKEYNSLVKSLKGATLTELVAVSKEMHAQSSEIPEQDNNAENLAAIRKALEEGDEVQLNQLIFKKNVVAEPAPDPSI